MHWYNLNTEMHLRLEIRPKYIKMAWEAVVQHTHLFQVGGSGSTYSFISARFLQFKHYFRHIIKGKLGSKDNQEYSLVIPGCPRLTLRAHVGHPGITSEYSWLSHI